MKALQTDWFKSLVEDCEAIKAEAIFVSHWALVEGYHQLGERIRQDADKMPITELLQQVQLKTSIGERTLWYAIKFADKYPTLDKVPEGKNITWKKLTSKYLLDNPSEQKTECRYCPLLGHCKK